MTSKNSNGYGFRPVHIAGEPRILKCYLPSSDSAILGRGDAVTLTTLSTGLITVTRASVGSNIDGIIVNPKLDGYTYLDTDYRRAASTISNVSVQMVNPLADIYSIEADGVTSFSATLANKFCDLATIADANSTTGISTMKIDLNTAGATSGQLKVLGLDFSSADPGNAAGDAYSDILVYIANT